MMHDLVQVFANNVAIQNRCILEGDAVKGNKAAKKYIKAFRDLVSIYGDEGRAALSRLFDDPDLGVRAMTASFLLRYKTKEALQILNTIALGDGFVAFEAGESIKRWEEGVWALDSAE